MEEAGLFALVLFFSSVGWAYTTVTANKGKYRYSTTLHIVLITLLFKLSLSALRP